MIRTIRSDGTVVVLNRDDYEAANRLFEESVEQFRAAHRKGMERLRLATTRDERAAAIDQAVAEEGEAIRRQKQAVDLMLKAAGEP